MRRKRGPIRMLVGLLMLVIGAGGVAIGVAGAVNARSAIEDSSPRRSISKMGGSSAGRGGAASGVDRWAVTDIGLEA